MRRRSRSLTSACPGWLSASPSSSARTRRCSSCGAAEASLPLGRREALFVSQDGGALAHAARASFACSAPDGWRAEAAIIGPRRATPPLTQRLKPELEVTADLLVAIGADGPCSDAVGEVEARPAPERAAALFAIDRQVSELVASRLAAVPACRDAHQRRLAQVLPALAADFGTTRRAAEIRACAEAVLSPVEDSGLARFADEAVRARLLAAADRETRARLEQDVCVLVQERAAMRRGLQSQRRALADGPGFERHAPEGIRAESAGSDPARQVWPTVVQVMAEVGIDLADRKPRKLLREMQLHADWAVTMGCGDDAVLTQFDDARVRSHVETLALRQTRECLRRDVCELVPA
jgi:hypothetical protein